VRLLDAAERGFIVASVDDMLQAALQTRPDGRGRLPIFNLDAPKAFQAGTNRCAHARPTDRRARPPPAPLLA